MWQAAMCVRTAATRRRNNSSVSGWPNRIVVVNELFGSHLMTEGHVVGSMTVAPTFRIFMRLSTRHDLCPMQYDFC